MSKNVNLKMTGERVVPHDLRTIEEYLQYLRHLFIYEHVSNILSGHSHVLEIGFGEGYGTKILADKCDEIVAIDIMKDAVEYAQRKYGDSKCSFQYYDGNKIPYNDSSFDVVVSFQVIEHIHDDNNFIAEIYRVLKYGGNLFLTTPNRETRLKPGQEPWNRYHVREYSNNQLGAILKRSFQHVEILGLKASDEIMRLELNRIHQGLIVSLALKIGVRKWIPHWIDPLLARLIGILKGQKKITSENKNFMREFSTKDFWLDKNNVQLSLDLFGQCSKEKAVT